MSLSDNALSKAKKSKPTRAMTAKNFHWSDKQKTEAVQSWLLLGNLALTSRVLGIPEITLRVWKATAWWKDLVAEIKSQETIQMSGRLQKIVDASLTAVEDRLLNGDVVFDQKTGETVRKPVALRDAHKVAVDLQARQDVLEKKLSGSEAGASSEASDDKLEKLAERFAEFASRKLEQRIDKQRTVDIEDAEIIGEDDAIHEEREEGL